MAARWAAGAAALHAARQALGCTFSAPSPARSLTGPRPRIQRTQPCTQLGSPFPLPMACLRAASCSHLPLALGLPRCCRRAGVSQTSSATTQSPCTWCAHLLPCVAGCQAFAVKSLWSAWFGLSPLPCGDEPPPRGHLHGVPLLAAVNVSAGCLVCLVSFKSAVAGHQRDSWQMGRPGVAWVLERVFFLDGHCRCASQQHLAGPFGTWQLACASCIPPRRQGPHARRLRPNSAAGCCCEGLTIGAGGRPGVAKRASFLRPLCPSRGAAGGRLPQPTPTSPSGRADNSPCGLHAGAGVSDTVPHHGTDLQAGQQAVGLHLCFLQAGWFLEEHRTQIAVQDCRRDPSQAALTLLLPAAPKPAGAGQQQQLRGGGWPSDPLRTLAAQGLFLKKWNVLLLLTELDLLARPRRNLSHQ